MFQIFDIVYVTKKIEKSRWKKFTEFIYWQKFQYFFFWFFSEFFNCSNFTVLQIFTKKKYRKILKKKGKKSGKISRFSPFFNVTDPANFDGKKIIQFFWFFKNKTENNFQIPTSFLHTLHVITLIVLRLLYLLVCYVNPRKCRIYHKHSTAANNVNDH